MDDEEKQKAHSDGLALLGEIIIALANELSQATIVYDRHSTRFVIDFYDLLFEMDAVLANYASNLETFQNEKRIGWRVHWIHATGKNLDDFHDLLRRLTRWTEGKKKPLRTLKIWTPSLDHQWDRLNNNDYGYSGGLNAIENWDAIINSFQEKLQANKSPNPKLFPSDEVISEISETLSNLRLQAVGGKQTLRDLATTRLKVSDFF